MLAPIIPNATIGHEDCLFPQKKASLPPFLPTNREAKSSMPKYNMTITRTSTLRQKLTLIPKKRIGIRSENQPNALTQIYIAMQDI